MIRWHIGYGVVIRNGWVVNGEWEASINGNMATCVKTGEQFPVIEFTADDASVLESEQGGYNAIFEKALVLAKKYPGWAAETPTGTGQP